jgi:hypothetical protein
VGPNACGGQRLRAVFVAVASSLVLLLASCRSVPDSVMLGAFDQHEEILDQLVQMARADNLSCPIPAAGHADRVSPARLGEYQRLLRSAKVFGISPQKNTGCIFFPSVQESALLAMHSHARGYHMLSKLLWFLQPPTPRRKRARNL